MKRLVYVLLFVFVLAGCSASIEDLSRVTYIKYGQSLQQVMQNGLAILPINSGSGLEGYRRPFGDAINYFTLKYKPQNAKIISWQDTQRKMNDNDLITAFQDALVKYQTTSMIDKNVLKKISQSVGARYLLFIRLGDLQQGANVGEDLFGGTIVNRTLGLKAHVLIWDSVDGDIVWECMGGASAEEDEFSRGLDQNPMSYSNMAARGIIQQLYQRTFVEEDQEQFG